METSGILSGPEILKQIEAGRITIDPFNPSRINPASFDLTLGTSVCLYTASFHPANNDTVGVDGISIYSGSLGILDSKEPWVISKFEIDPKLGWVLKPGLCYLMHTAERVTTDHYVTVLDGKSSLARMFIKIHETAGYGDPGFDGQYTLEVTTQIPVRVYSGMRFCQIRFHTITGEIALYKKGGHYQGDLAKGPVHSQAYKQFDT